MYFLLFCVLWVQDLDKWQPLPVSSLLAEMTFLYMKLKGEEEVKLNPKRKEKAKH